jgi:hypothetical protein
MTGYVTTAEIAERAGTQKRTIQKRIKRLGIQPLRVGTGFLLTLSQAERVLRDKRKPGRRTNKYKLNGNGNGGKQKP